MKAIRAERKDVIDALQGSAAVKGPEAKRLRPTPPEPKTVRKQVEYYLSDENLRYDRFFHEKIAGSANGWLDMSLVLSCNKMKAIRAERKDVIEALQESKIEVRDDGNAVRRPGKCEAPTTGSTADAPEEELSPRPRWRRHRSGLRRPSGAELDAGQGRPQGEAAAEGPTLVRQRGHRQEPVHSCGFALRERSAVL